MSSKPGLSFRSKLHKKIYLHSSDWVYRIGKKEVEFLAASTKKISSIGGFFFQLIEDPQGGYIFFKLTERVREQKRFYEFRDGDFYLRGNKAIVHTISLEDFDDLTGKESITEEERAEAKIFHSAFVTRERRRREDMLQDPLSLVKVETIKVDSTVEEKEMEIPQESAIAPENVPAQESEENKVDVVENAERRTPSEGREEELETVRESVLVYSPENSNPLKNVPLQKGDESRADVTITAADSLFERPVEIGRKSRLWFTLDRDFDNTDQFWADLREYYKNNPIDIQEEQGEESEIPPVFARKDTSINLPKFHEAFLAKISERVEQLSTKKMEIERDIKILEDNLIEKGRIPDGDKNFQELLISKKNMSECLERAKKALAEYEETSKHLKSEAKKIIEDRFYLDIHGQPSIVSKYHEFITLKLMDLNQEINFLHRRHMELEHLLIKRLKEVQKVNETKSRIIKLEQEELMEAFRDDIEEYFAKEVDARRRKDIREMMGEIHENTAEIQKHIEDEKKKIKYYMDNLQDLSRYEKYDTSLFQYKKRKQRFRRQTDEFNRYVYRLKMMVEDRENTRRSFFENTRTDILNFQKEVASTFSETDNLAKNSLASLWEQWDQEARPCINILSTRSAQIIDAFSFVPATQIKRIYKFKSRLREEANRRQAEWERIFEEVKQEFRKLGYETMYPLPSELDGKYIKKLEEASLKLSEVTKNTLFIPTSKFSLAPLRDVTLGLDPKMLDDDRFVVIDQVWSTLTPEQEEKLQQTLKMENQKKRFETSVNSMNFLKREQMKDLKHKYKPKRTPLKILSKPITRGEKYEKMRALEEAELKMMKDDHYLFSNTIGEFKDLLYSISKKLFQTKSVRMVKRNIKLTDDGKVDDGGTQFFSEYDYFIMTPDRKIFRDIAEDIDLRQDDAVFDEPNEEILEYIANPEHVERITKKEEEDDPSLPSISDLAKLTAGKLKTLREKRLFDLSLLKEKMMTLDEEMEKLKDYHQNHTQTLELVLSDREELFKDMQNSREDMSLFLSEKEEELEALITKTEKELDISLQEINESLFLKPKNKELKKNFTRWYVRLIHGENERKRK